MDDMGEVVPDLGDTTRGPPPCQEPDCEADAVAETDHTYCEEHADLEGNGGSRDESGPEGNADPSEGADGGEAEPDVAEVELDESDLGGGGDLFEGIEGATDDDGDGDGMGLDEDGDPFDLGDRGGKMEDAINDGAARMAVVGLDDDEKEGLEDEMRDVFEAFRLGYFGAEFFEEYVMVGDEEQVDPAWGLAGAAFCCAAVCLWMRPDGDEQMIRMKDAIANIAGGEL